MIQEGSYGEVYNMAIRGTQGTFCVVMARLTFSAMTGANLGGSDGIDVWGTNHWIHDVEVTNRDECVTVKVREHIDCDIVMLKSSLVFGLPYSSRAL